MSSYILRLSMRKINDYNVYYWLIDKPLLYGGLRSLRGESVDYSNGLYSKGEFLKIAEINS